MADHQRGTVVFDVVGTLVGFESWFRIIDETIGGKLKPHTISATAFGHTWMTHADLEYTFLCLAQRYTPFSAVMEAIFYRTLGFMGVESPRGHFTDEELDRCQAGYAMLELRPGARECISTLREAGFNVRCLTSANMERVQGYFRRGQVDMPAENFFSCDSIGLSKPHLTAYQPVYGECQGKGETWFAAAHMWDVAAARKVGFKGAYCSVYEKEDCLQIHGGEMDVMAADLHEMAKMIVAGSS